MKILITGANGYVGKTLHAKLKHLYSVHIITREICDLLNHEEVDNFFDRNYYDVVIHCAIVGGSRLIDDGIDVYTKNVRMFDNILKRVCRRSG